MIYQFRLDNNNCSKLGVGVSLTDFLPEIRFLLHYKKLKKEEMSIIFRMLILANHYLILKFNHKTVCSTVASYNGARKCEKKLTVRERPR